MVTTKAPTGETIVSMQAPFVIPGNTFSLNGNFSRVSNPTITYAPLSGDVIKTYIINPLDLNNLLHSLDNSWDATLVLPYCIKDINYQRNDVFSGINPDFGDLANDWHNLTRDKVIHLVFLNPDNTTPTARTPAKPDDNTPPILTKQKPDKKAKKDGDQTNDKDKKASTATKPNDKWEEAAGNLATFTSNLVKKQNDNTTNEKKSTEASFLIVDNPQGKSQKAEKDRLILKDFLTKLFNDIDIDGIKPPELISKLMLKKSLKFKIITGSPLAASEKSTSDQDGIIFIQPRSLFQVLLVISRFIHEPETQKKWIVEPEIPWYEKPWYTNPDSVIPSLIVSRPEGPSLPGLLGKPDQFAAVSYKGYWYYVPDSEFKSKEILSYMMGIFTMIETGAKQTTPVLTLPVNR